jgi:hypothetical protein
LVALLGATVGSGISDRYAAISAISFGAKVRANASITGMRMIPARKR